MKPKPRALTSLGVERRQRLNAGEFFGHLEVVEPVYRGGRLVGYRCRCHNSREGKPCGNLCVKKTATITRDMQFKACPVCAQEHVREHRRAYMSQSFFAHVAEKGGAAPESLRRGLEARGRK
jgi:hypothetical protein